MKPEWADRVHMCSEDFNDAASKKVPDEDASVAAANGQQGAEPIERACQRNAHTIQHSVKVLQVQRENVYNKCTIERLKWK